MSEAAPTEVGSFADWDRIDKICDRFEAALRANEAPALEAFLQGVDPALRPRLLLELLALELTYRVRSEQPPSDEQLLAAHPELRLELIPLLAELKAAGADPRSAAQSSTATARSPAGRLVIRCPQCHEPTEVGGPAMEVVCPVCGASFEVVEGGTLAAPPLQSIGHFELLGYLGSGTFGTVWKARDTRLHRIVAVKIPRGSLVAAEGTGRFLHEARAAAQLNHPNIVPVHEVGLEGTDVYIVQDLVRGAPLSDWIRDRRLTFAESVRICVGIAAGLQHAHERGVVHRDIKPANVMLDHEGTPRITDFGLAKRDAVEATVSLDGQVLGTPAYMAPEQAGGDAKLCDARTDVYALGVVLFQMLTGELPFRGNARMLIHQLLHQEPPRLRKLNSRVPKDLETICLKCLEKEPRKRYASARDLSEDLQRYERGEPIAARPVTAAGRLVRWSRREPVVASLLAVLALMLATASAVFAQLGYQILKHRADLQAARVVASIQQGQAERTARQEGYRGRAWKQLETAVQLGPALVDRDELRQAAAGLLGDFVGNAPLDIDCRPFPAGAAAVALQPSGRFVAVGFQDGAVRLFATEGGRLLEPALVAGQSPLAALAFASDQRLVGVDEAGRVFYWSCDPNSGALREATAGSDSLTNAEESGFTYDLTADGRYALGWKGRSVVLVDLAASAARRDFSGGPEGAEFSNAVYRADLDLLVASYSTESTDREEHGMVAWKPSAPQQSRTVATRVGYGYERSLSLAPTTGQSCLVAVGGDDGMALYECDANTLEFTSRSYARTDSIKSLRFTPDGQVLGAQDIRGRIDLLRPSTGLPFATLRMERSPGVVTNDLAFSADRRFAASFSRATVRVWNLQTAEQVRALGHEDAIPCLVFTRDGAVLISGSKDGRVCFWDPRSGTMARQSLELGGKVQTVALSPDGRWLATGAWTKKDPIRVWNLSTREYATPPVHRMGDTNRLAFSSDGAWLAGAGAGVDLWQVHSSPGGQIPSLTEVKHFDTDCQDLAFDGDQALVWQGFSNRPELPGNRLHRFVLYSTEPTTLSQARMHQGWHGLGLDRSTGHVSLVAADRRGETWDTRRDVLVRSFGGPEAFQSPQLALSSDGRLLACLGKANEVSLWVFEGDSARRLLSFRPEAANVYSLAWSPDDALLAVGLVDGGITIWNVAGVRARLAELGAAW
ncbi:MAG: protein kinase [Pirellulales bacterium]